MSSIVKENKTWYPLDVSAKVFPILESADNPNTFRIVMTMTEEVDKEVLKEALVNILPRFPYYKVSMQKGFFWYYLEHNDRDVIIWPDSNQPSDRLNPHLNNGYLFRVKYFNKNIVIEFFHALTDGGGALEFFKCLAHQYLFLQGKVQKNLTGIFDIQADLLPGEAEDAFLSAAENISLPKEKKERMLFNSFKSYQFLEKNLPYGETVVVTGSVDMDGLKNISKEYDITITQLLIVLFMEAAMRLQDIQVEKKKHHKNVAISVPVNLRQYHKVPCMRNFTMFVVPKVDPNQTRTFEEIIKVVKKYMIENLSQESVERMIMDNVKLASSKFISSIPLVIKNLIVQYIGRTQSRKQFTSVISNVGLFRLPDEMMPFVEDVNVMVGPARAKKRACTAIGFNGKLNVTFSRNVEGAFIERHVLRRLVEMGAKVSVTSNRGVL